MSPITSAAMISCEYDVQSENLASSWAKRPRNSFCPVADFQAPRTVTGSRRDQIASRGATSPLCSAISASLRRDSTHTRKSSRSLTLHLHGTQPSRRWPLQLNLPNAWSTLAPGGIRDVHICRRSASAQSGSKRGRVILGTETSRPAARTDLKRRFGEADYGGTSHDCTLVHYKPTFDWLRAVRPARVRRWPGV